MRWTHSLWFLNGAGRRHGLGLQYRCIAAGTVFKATRDTADGGDADAGVVVDVTVGPTLEQQGHDAPAVGQRFQLGRGTQVTEKGKDCGAVSKAGKGVG